MGYGSEKQPIRSQIVINKTQWIGKGSTVESYQALRDAKKKEAAEHLFKCIDHLRSITQTNDAWPWVQLTYALTAFDAGLYDLSLNSSRLVQVREDDHVSLSAEKANEAVKASDLAGC